MENLEKEMSSETPELTSDKDPKTVVKATVFLIQKGIKDQVFSVSLLLGSLNYMQFFAMQLLHQALTSLFKIFFYTLTSYVMKCRSRMVT